MPITLSDTTMTNFRELNTPESLVQALDRMKITVPTPIQTMAIPPALEGKDILASAQTGTGKTIAFLIPLIAKLMENPTMTALVVAPTRELAMQVRDAAILLVNRSSMHTALLIGGDPMPKQFMQLRRNPRIVVGTPGRITDHLYRGTLTLDNTGFVVIDEMDRMLDIGLREQLDDIRKHLTAVCQTLMFSATMPDHIITLSKQYLKDPVRVSVGATNQAAPKIEQSLIHTTTGEIFSDLIKELEARPGSAIIFVRTKRGAAQLAEKLNRTIITDNNRAVADAIHGDLRQRKREQVILLFRKGEIRILVATDIAARGLDIPHVKGVFNWELPENAEDYVHRIGRTGRAGATGFACSFIRKNVDERKWREIDRLQNPGNYSGPAEPSSNGRRGGRSSSRSNNRPYGAGNSSRPRQRSSFGSSWSPEGGSSSNGGSSEKRFERSEERPARRPRSENDFGGNRGDFGSRGDFGNRSEGRPAPRASNRGGFGENRSYGENRGFGSDKNSFDKPRSSSWSSDRGPRNTNSGSPRSDFNGERSSSSEGGRSRFGNNNRGFGGGRPASSGRGRPQGNNAQSSFGNSRFKKERTSDSF